MSNLSGTLSGVFTAVLIVLFVALVAWAWSSKRRASFDASARLPLEEDAEVHAHTDRERRP